MSDISVKALRNLTSQQILDLDPAEPTYVTHRGARIAEIRPLHPPAALDALLHRVYSRTSRDSGALDELVAGRTDSIAAQNTDRA